MSDTAQIEVICPGVLEVLSVGKGDIKLVVGGDSPEEIEKGRQVIEEMLRKGYAIFVETDKGPSRVKKFNPRRMTYLISEIAEGEPADSGGPQKRKVTQKEVPVAGSRAKAVGRTAGG